MISVYQIIEQHGEMDDYSVRVYATYLNLNRALADLQKLQKLENMRIEQGKECQKCYNSIAYDNGINPSCPKAAFKDNGFGWECENFDLHQEPCTYYIKSIDVIE